MIKVLSFACPFARVYDVCGQIGGKINAFMHELPSPASAAAACAMHDCGAVEIIDSLCDDEEEEAVETDTFRSTRSVLWNSGSTPCVPVCTEGRVFRNFVAENTNSADSVACDCLTCPCDISCRKDRPN